MEERRLKNLLSHLSVCSSSPLGNSAVLNVINKAEFLERREKSHVLIPDTAQWNPHHLIEEQKAYRSISKSRSSSNIFESRQSGFVEETRLRGAWSHPTTPSSQDADAQLKAASQCKQTDFLSAFSKQITKNPSSKERSFIPHSELTTQKCGCLLRSKTFSSEVEGDSPCMQMNDRGGAEHQTSTEAPDILQSSSEQNLLTCRDMHVLDSQPVEAGIDTSGSMTLSRNNAMTGQRRRIVEDCIFCLIIQGQSPAFKLYEDEMCVCILDVHPLTHGHSLLIPKAHFPSLELTPPEVAAAMCATVPFISMAIMQATNCDSFNLLVNSGKAAGQVVFHTHFHIIPRRSGDNLWRSEDGSRRTLPVGHETAGLVQQIRHNLSNKCL